jgi:hypothetical protein
MLVHTLLAIQSAIHDRAMTRIEVMIATSQASFSIARKTFDSTDQPLVQFISMIAMNTYILVLNRLLLFN